MDRKQIFSIGIDIGTSTFQMIISQLTIENALPAYVIPKFQITNKEIMSDCRCSVSVILLHS